jgi:hypothetical protein
MATKLTKRRIWRMRIEAHRANLPEQGHKF